jgi:hypothetical protein
VKDKEVNSLTSVIISKFIVLVIVENLVSLMHTVRPQLTLQSIEIETFQYTSKQTFFNFLHIINRYFYFVIFTCLNLEFNDFSGEMIWTSCPTDKIKVLKALRLTDKL